MHLINKAHLLVFILSPRYAFQKNIDLDFSHENMVWDPIKHLKLIRLPLRNFKNIDNFDNSKTINHKWNEIWSLK